MARMIRLLRRPLGRTRWLRETFKLLFKDNGKVSQQVICHFRTRSLSSQNRFIGRDKKFARVDAEEVKMQSANWSSAVICMVLGANPPMAVFEGFIKRVWGHLGIAQIARMTMGLTMVKFIDEATRDHVLENGIIHFDRQSVIVRPWTADLSDVHLVRSVPLWIRLHDLGLQYWGSKCLSAQMSTIGNPIMVDKFTRERSRIQFARVLVEMEVTDNPPKSIQYINELGQMMEQGVEYEWLPIKCKTCAGYGHSMTDCRKDKNAQWGTGELKEEESKQVVSQANPKDDKVQADPVEILSPNKDGLAGSEVRVQKNQHWLTPKRVVVQAKEGQRSASKANNVDQKNKKANKFVVLQESLGSGKEEESSQVVHRLVKMTSVQQSFGVTFVYGFNSIDGRRSLWEGLQRPTHMDKAWLILGDFNAHFSGKDRLGGKPISDLKLDDSIRWLGGAHFEPLKSSTVLFRWEIISDHCSCLVRIQSLENMGSKIFRFYNYWSEHPEFHDQVLTSWRSPIKATGIKAEDERFAAEAFSVQERLYHSLLVQRSKITWLRQGDLNTSFFYAFLKKCKAENGIVSFINEEGNLVYKYSEVVSHYVGHFRAFLGSTSSATGKLKIQNIEMGPKLSVEQQVLLLKPFSKKEIWEALFSIPITKAPGPDGFGSGFFKIVWHDIEDEVCAAISQCFETGLFLPELHETTLSLIPKVANPSRAIDYRPIACCSTLHKCMAKLLCKRMAVVLPDLVQIDISKAYDTVDWDFLEDLLNALRFPMKFIGWVMSCVRSTSYSLLMNGRIQGKFKVEKGLRQDDLLIFYKGSLPAVRSVKVVLEDFATASGLSINSGKSQIFFGGVPSFEGTRIVLEINLSEGTFPLKYLGVPMRPTKWKHADCEVIVQKYRLKIQNWASRHLSFVGRIQLINSVLLGLRNYWMTIFVLPQSIVKEIEKICRVFLWGTSGQRSKMHIPSWNKVCLLKAYGGLGFGDRANWNRAVLAKYVWALSDKPDLLWVKWINSIYLKGVNIWNYELKGDCSWYWRKLCRLKDHFRPTAILSAGVQGKFQTSRLYNSLLSTRLVNNIFNWLGFAAWPLDFMSWMVWLTQARSGVTSDIVNMSFAAVIYSIWRNRNRCIYDGYSSSVLSLVQEVKFTTKCRLYKVSRSQNSVPDQMYVIHLQCN
ncbi:uncharacterized protein LOC133832121 [Humulus lupulus]|uniref:uncharacterized protein LOC133832121 n=1 Tax=Humulus lupulus TaxID=3486 RepID=UPI002B403494|nr:uncharacterized protein LOC133832121 [Humulus lupulus]